MASYEQHLIEAAARNSEPIPKDIWEALAEMEAELERIETEGRQRLAR